MRITEGQLRRFISKALLSESTLSEEDRKKTNQKFREVNKYIGNSVSIDPGALVGLSEIGAQIRPDDETTIQDGESIVYKSYIYSDTQIARSNIQSSTIGESSTVVGSVINGTRGILRSIIKNSKLTYSVDSILYSVEGSKIEYTNVTDSEIKGSTITGGSDVSRCTITGCGLIGVKIYNEDTSTVPQNYLKLFRVRSTGTEFFRRNTDKPMYISNAQIDWAKVIDSNVDQGAKITGAQGAAPWIENAVISGQVQITGKAEVLGIERPDGTFQNASVTGNAKVSENAKVSGMVSGNAQVSGDAKIHGLAHITGDCRVFGTAEMISGTFTRGVFTEGRHEGGDSTLSKIATSIGL